MTINVSLGELVALYSGMKFIGDEEMDLREESCDDNPDLTAEIRTQCATYRYSSPYGFSIDLPAEKASSYRTTLGFKANHSFRNNCGFIAIVHPRFERYNFIQKSRRTLIFLGSKTILTYCTFLEL